MTEREERVLRKALTSLPAKNTDRELWRERPDDYYADSIHVTANGGIGINCGGTVIVKPLREWHTLALAARKVALRHRLFPRSRMFLAHRLAALLSSIRKRQERRRS